MSTCRVSLIIKALNEEKNIQAAIESSLRAVAEVGGEVILADSHSSDRTVAIASAYPIRIVQLANPEERCCGAGPQLGYQHARGDYIYILDGDMQMLPGFLPKALAFLAQHPEAAGVAGHLVEQNTTSLEYRERGLRTATYDTPVRVDRLDGGGLYLRRAIEEAGYFSDRNLHSYEEIDLAARLRAAGWSLWRIPADSVTHYGHDAPPYQLLRRRWRTRYVCGAGELVRACLGQRSLRLILRDVRELRLYAGVLAWWLALLLVPLWPIGAAVRAASFALIAAMPLAIMVARKRSFERALYSVTSWCFHAAGLVRGFATRRRPPREAIASHILKDLPQARSPSEAVPPFPSSTHSRREHLA